MKCATIPIVLLAFPLRAQTLVSDQPQDRTVLLEEYSAVNCGNCPAAHAQSASWAQLYPSRFVAVEVHGGGLAIPSGDQPDFRNQWASGLWSFYGVNSQPRGAINRIPISGNVVVSTSAWTNAINNALALSSPVNIGLASTFDPGTRTLTVDVELYYTGDGLAGSDRICVLLKENHLIGYQQDYINGAQSAYDHNNILRAYITDLWGDEVSTTAQGTLVSRSYTYTVPEAWDIANCDVVAFVSEYQGEVYQARSVMADGGFTMAIAPGSIEAATPPFPVPASDLTVIPLSTAEAQAMVRISDNMGRAVFSGRSASGAVVLDVRAWPSGVYSFNITGAMGASRSGRLVVQH